MTEQRLLAAFATFDEPVRPDPQFADALFATLVTEAGASVARPWHRIRARILRALGLEQLPVGRQAQRLAYLVAILGLLLAAIMATLLVAAQLRREADPDDLVRLSKAAYVDPPAFSVTYALPSGDSQTVAADGNGTWRIENSSEPGSYWLWDGAKLGRYESSQQTWQTGVSEDLGIIGLPLPFGSELTWGTGVITGSSGPPTVLPCPHAERLPDGEILGHAVDHVVCTDMDMQYWLDRETHIVLRMEAGPTTPHWSGSDLPMFVVAESFELGQRRAEAFAWTGPPGAYAPDTVPPSTLFSVDAVPPAWTGTTARGESFSTADVPGPAVYLFAALWCGPCGPEAEAVGAELAKRPELAGVTVTNDSAGTTVGYFTMHPTQSTLIADPDLVFANAWGITGFPTLILVGADGRVAGAVRGGIEADSVALVLDALEAGKPIPDVPLAPEDTGWTPPAYIVDGPPAPRVLGAGPGSDEEPVTLMPFGALMPSWERPGLDGEVVQGESLIGVPVVIWFYPACANCPTDDLAAFDAAIDSMGGDVEAVVVISEETTPGDTLRLFAAHGWDVPVVLDWDGALARRFSLNVSGALVFDGGGHLADARATPPTADELRQIADVLGATKPSSSPR